MPLTINYIFLLAANTIQQRSNIFVVAKIDNLKINSIHICAVWPGKKLSKFAVRKHYVVMYYVLVCKHLLSYAVSIWKTGEYKKTMLLLAIIECIMGKTKNRNIL